MLRHAQERIPRTFSQLENGPQPMALTIFAQGKEEAKA